MRLDNSTRNTIALFIGIILGGVLGFITKDATVGIISGAALAVVFSAIV